MTEIKYSHSELSQVSKLIFPKLIDDEIFDKALQSASYFDYVDLKINGYAVLVGIKTRACIHGDNESKKYDFVGEKRFNYCESDLEPMELKRFIHIKNRRREKRGIKTMFNCHPVSFLSEAKKETFVKWRSI